ncbi:YggS family pyridoxal phosphate-dependent enzyme [Alkalitalea saponilacus]|uniref:Pyridoxal phosphate homeostasis protein n=1 Tax=Alkalitalea saponilacus TaxID=889453 RepID=A0A1T5HB03_9BACT|nr:YggS family pyridoxal phosphate-dependent enzyme [Alkalitalea saponilacus]ASB50793.1 YggS family pyridoxal phosphate enzyme [Alkalitalea saponilacus]SKC17750.1 hypothetical protein SAMN03080601_02187 [Alkalitalea saponilacus]
MSIKTNLQRIKESIPGGVNLIAVSKTHPPELILEAYHHGQRQFGENKVQELTAKVVVLPDDIEWHMIGHLQSNKVKYIAPFVSLIHGVDSYKLLKVIDKEAKKCHRNIKCLLQIHIAKESTKFGLSGDELHELLKNDEWRTLSNVQIIGLMGMATFTENQDIVRAEFKSLKQLYDEVKEQYFSNDSGFREISMGMSDDYRIAIEEGSTMVRVGSAIFGER